MTERSFWSFERALDHSRESTNSRFCKRWRPISEECKLDLRWNPHFSLSFPVREFRYLEVVGRRFGIFVAAFVLPPLLHDLIDPNGETLLWRARKFIPIHLPGWSRRRSDELFGGKTPRPWSGTMIRK